MDDFDPKLELTVGRKIMKKVKMSWIKASSLAGLLIGSSCPAQTQPTSAIHQVSPSKPSYSITVSGPAAPIRLGMPVEVVIAVTNTTDKDLYWSSAMGKDSVYRDFRFFLTRDGRDVETTFFNRKMTGRQRSGDPDEVTAGPGTAIALAHPPGKMFEIPINLTRLYKITEPGLYTLKVSRYDEVTKTTVRSNVLTFRIEQ